MPLWGQPRVQFRTSLTREQLRQGWTSTASSTPCLRPAGSKSNLAVTDAVTQTSLGLRKQKLCRKNCFKAPKPLHLSEASSAAWFDNPQVVFHRAAMSHLHLLTREPGAAAWGGGMLLRWQKDFRI